MARTWREVSVRFFLLEPGLNATFTSGSFPKAVLFDRMRRELDPATDEYRLQESLFGETLCLLHEAEDGSANEVLGAYYKDLMFAPLAEYKGELNELILRKKEGLVDGTFMMFFPGDVVGLVRSSNKAPGPAKIGKWLTFVPGVSCYLDPLRDPDATAQLANAQGRMRRLFLRVPRRLLGAVDEASPKVASALRAAADAAPASDQIGLEIGVTDPVRRGAYGMELVERIEELFGLFDEFDAAEVSVSGLKKPINLKRSYIESPQPVHMFTRSRVGIPEAAQAISAAWRAEGSHILNAARIQRG